MPFTAITAEQVAVDAPYTSELGTTIKDDLDYLNANVAAPTDVSNGGFEVDNDSDDVPDNWTVGLYTGGAGAFNTTTPFEGANLSSSRIPAAPAMAEAISRAAT